MMTPEEQTRLVWGMFVDKTDDELDKLLETAEIKPVKARSLKIHQAMIVWFHGSIPSLNELIKLAGETDGAEIRAWLNAERTKPLWVS